MTKITWNLPIKTVSESNSSEHWTKKSQRHRTQQFFIRHAFKVNAIPINLPCIVTMTRLGSRTLDDDNLLSAFKWIRDEISVCLIPEKRIVYVDTKGKFREIKGQADSDKRISWKYEQEKSKKSGIRIQLEFQDHD